MMKREYFSRLILVIAIGVGTTGKTIAETAEEIAQQAAGLVPALGSADDGERERANRELERICYSAGRPGAEAERRAVAAALSGRLIEDGIPTRAREWICRRLGQIGRAESAAALGKVLAAAAEPELRDAARRALESNPTFPAVRELRSALRDASGELRLALMRSLGKRRDILSVGPLLDEARGDDPESRLAAMEALAEIGDRSGLDPVDEALGSAAGPDRDRLLGIYVRFAWRLSQSDEGGAARRIFLRLMDEGGRWRAAGIIGIGATGIPSEAPAVIAAASDPDPEIRGAAREALKSLRGATPAMIAALEKASEDLRADLVAALAARGDSSALPAVLKAAADPSPAVREAAVGALAALGGEQASARLIALLRDEAEPVRGAAELALAAAGPAAGAGLRQALEKESDPAVQAALARILARSRDSAALDALIAGTAGSPDAVRREIYAAIGLASHAPGFPLLLEALRKEKGDVLDAAVKALGRFRDDGSTAALIDEARDAAPPVKAALIRALGSRAHPGVAGLLAAAARDADPGVRAAAVEALAGGAGKDALPLLLEAADSGPEASRDAALRGCLRIAGSLGAGKEALDVYVRALALARRDEERRLALRGIGEIGGPGDLERIRPFLGDGPLQRDAGRAALRLAEALPEERRQEAIAILSRILEIDVDDATATQAARRLRRLGVEVDIARRGGFVPRWWILGPFPAAAAARWAAASGPEKPIDPAAAVAVDGETRRWKSHRTDHPRGIVDLHEAVDPADSLGALLYAEVEVAEAGDALLKMGSDDQIHCWFNGRKVHAFEGNRGVGIDQDTAGVRLEKGRNRILLAVTNDGGPWAAVLRLTGRDGRPLAYEITQPPQKN